MGIKANVATGNRRQDKKSDFATVDAALFFTRGPCDLRRNTHIAIQEVDGNLTRLMDGPGEIPLPIVRPLDENSR